MSITTGWLARIGPWPPSCGSTAWSPGAQIVWAGTKPSAIMRVLTAERRSSAVNFRPSRSSQPLPDPAGLERLDPGQQARLGGAQRGLDRAHLARLLDLALGPERLGPEVEADPAPAELLREAEREALRHRDAAQAELPQRQRDHVGGRSALAALLERRGQLRPGQHAVDRGLRARPVHLQVAHHQDAGAALLDEEERVGCEEARRIQDVRVGLGRGVDQAALRLSLHLRYRHRR